ncbi:MAG: NAD(P)-dependent oxidoreductase [Actinomycetota bacterium]
MTGRRCVVFGSGAVARGRADALVEAGATVTVVARPPEDGDLAGAFLAVAATGDAAEKARIHAEAEREGVLLNAVDDPAPCHFAVPAVLHRGDLTVTVSTGGRAPGVRPPAAGRAEPGRRPRVRHAPRPDRQRAGRAAGAAAGRRGRRRCAGHQPPEHRLPRARPAPSEPADGPPARPPRRAPRIGG